MYLPATSLVLSSDLTTDMADGFSGVRPLSPVPAEKAIKKNSKCYTLSKLCRFHASDTNSITLNMTMLLVCY